MKRHKMGRRCQEPGGDRLVFIVLTRAGRINQPSTDADSRRCTTEHRQLRRGQNGQFFLAPAPLDVRISTQRPQARAGSIDEDTIERIPKGKPLNQVRADKLHSSGTASRDRSFEQLHSLLANIACHQQSGVSHDRSESGRLPAWRGTRIEHPFVRLGPGQQCDQLRCFVLHDKPALADTPTPERLAAFDDQCVRCELRIVHQHVLALQPLAELVRKCYEGDSLARSAKQEDC